jgi:glycosyltransferase involved in cell wall biosynthesis
MPSASRPSVAVFLDSPDENFRAMNLVGEMLVRQWKSNFRAEVAPVAFSMDLPHWGRRLRPATGQSAFNFDRAMGRFVVYPIYAAQQRARFDFYHVVDHTYAQLVHVLDPHRTGVFCHDLDAFRAILPGTSRPRAAWFRAMQRVTLIGMRSAAVVFYSTAAVRDEIERTGLIPASRLVQAPYGISPEFDANPCDDDDGAAALLAPLEGRPFLLHVGSAAARKRLDLLFEVFARLRTLHPELRLVQHGAALTEEHAAHLERCGIKGAFLQPAAGSRLDRRVLAGLYRRAKAVLVTSSAEGFGLPVIEALACGAPVFASDIPVLREVAEDAAIYCPMGDADAWTATLDRFLRGEAPPPARDVRLARASKYTWANHARTILDAYRSLGASNGTSSARTVGWS